MTRPTHTGPLTLRSGARRCWVLPVLHVPERSVLLSQLVLLPTDGELITEEHMVDLCVKFLLLVFIRRSLANSL